MIEFITEFVVKGEARGQCELAFGPGGAWSKLFSRCPGFRGTTLLRDTKNPLRFLAIEIWDTEPHREQALAESPVEYAELEATFGAWLDSRTEIGVFSMRAEATVRPRGKTGRTRGRTSR